MDTVEQVRSKARQEFRAALLDTTLDDNICGSIARGISEVGALSIRPGDTVVIKPNLTTAKSAANSGVTTRPDIVEALICTINAFSPTAASALLSLTAMAGLAKPSISWVIRIFAASLAMSRQ